MARLLATCLREVQEFVCRRSWSCKVQACKNSGEGQSPRLSRDVKNQKLWTDGLKACSDQEGLCKDQCEKGACKR